MKKIFVLAILAVIVAVFAATARPVYAQTMGVNPPIISPGDTVTIIVCAGGDTDYQVVYIHVTRPDGQVDTIGPHFFVGKNGCRSWYYPADFNGGTETPGKYEVEVEGKPVGYPHYDLYGSFTVLGGVSGCFIATAAYGTSMAPQIQVLRDFRDQCLLTNPVGEALVDFYYQISPPIAEFITEHPALKSAVRAALVPAVAMSTVAVKTTLAQKIAIVSSMVVFSTLLVFWPRRRTGKVRGRAN